MIATINLPGSSYFCYFHGSKSQCNTWLREKASEYKKLYGGQWTSNYHPAKIVSDHEFASWKYQDGSRVWREDCL